MSEGYSQFSESTESAGLNGYFRATRTATWGFLMALPLVILYEVGIVWVNMGQPGMIRISSEGILKSIFLGFGLTHEPLLLVGISLIVGIGILVRERKKNVRFSFRYPGLMILESSVYAIGLAFFASGVTQLLTTTLTIVQAGEPEGLAMKLVLSLGAGIYEELLFRVLLVGGLFLVLRKIFPNKRIIMYAIAAVVGAASFSAVHHLGSLGDPWELDIFLYRMISGLIFNVIFLVRGFAVVSWVHALYDVMVVTGFFSLFQAA